MSARQPLSPSPAVVSEPAVQSLLLLLAAGRLAGDDPQPSRHGPVTPEAARGLGVSQAHLEHLVEVGLVAWGGGPGGSSCPTDAPHLLLTPEGVELSCNLIVLRVVPLLREGAAMTLRHGSPLADRDGEKPSWRSGAQELWYRRRLVKKLGREAPAQEPVLEKFQEEGWPADIADPFPPDDSVKPVERLRTAVRHLNEDQVGPRIRFRVLTERRRIAWVAEE